MSAADGTTNGTIQPDAVMGPQTSQDIQRRILEIDYGARKRQMMILAGVSAPIAIYGFAGRATWAKTIGVLGLLAAGLAYGDLQRLDQERNAARGGMVLS